MYIIYITDYQEYHSIYPMALHRMEVHKAITAAENVKHFMFIEMLHAIEIYHMQSSAYEKMIEHLKGIAVIDNEIAGR